MRARRRRIGVGAGIAGGGVGVGVGMTDIEWDVYVHIWLMTRYESGGEDYLLGAGREGAAWGYYD